MTKDQLEIIKDALNFADDMFSQIQNDCDWDEERIMERLGWDPSTDLEYYNEMKENLGQARGIVQRGLE